MLYLSFNQEATCFACGKENGFIVYNCDPATERFNRLSKDNYGIGIVELLSRTNILALVGGGKNPKYPRNKVIIWDDNQNSCIAELEFKTPVTGVKLNRQNILITTNNKAYLYTLNELKLMTTFDTFNNPSGLASLSNTNSVIAVPGNTRGSVVIENNTMNKRFVISAHSNRLSSMVLNNDGTILATTSERGTLIRVWDTLSGKQIKELRRGIEVANINSLAFDCDTSHLLVNSNKGTVHVYSLLNTLDNPNRKSNLSSVSAILPSYFNSEWSSISFEVPSKSKCAFSTLNSNTIYAITPKGKLFKYEYDSKSAKCISETIFEHFSN